MNFCSLSLKMAWIKVFKKSLHDRNTGTVDKVINMTVAGNTGTTQYNTL